MEATEQAPRPIPEMPTTGGRLLASDIKPTTSDEAILYAAIGLALGSALLVAGAGAGSWLVGTLAVMLSTAGTLLSWRTRHWHWRRALRVGITCGLIASALFLSIVQLEIHAADNSTLYMALTEMALMMGLRMAMLPLILSFMLIRPDIIAFSLVPALAIFGLTGSQGEPIIAEICFLIFLPSALVALAQIMLLTGLPTADSAALQIRTIPVPQENVGGLSYRIMAWRVRHWLIISILITLSFGFGYVLLIPVSSYSSQYRMRLMMGAIYSMNAPMGPGLMMFRESERSFSVGRGPIKLDDTPVFTVRGEFVPYWRGEVFDLYTGREWSKSKTWRKSFDARDKVVKLQDDFPSPPGVHLLSHQVQISADTPAIFYGPGQIEQLTLTSSEPSRSQMGMSEDAGRIAGPSIHLTIPFESRHILVDRYGCVSSLTGMFYSGSGYQVVSAPFEMSDYLRFTRSVRSKENPETHVETGYRAGLPEELPMAYRTVPFGARRVAELARAITSSAHTPEGKLMALIGYLQSNCTYTLQAPKVPRGKDAADYFIFEKKRGYCDLFATALAVMARAADIPSRLVTGYLASDRAVLNAAPSSSSHYVIRKSDAHAWVEVYLAPWGWVTVDATPAGDEVSPLSAVGLAWQQLKFFTDDHPLLAAAFIFAVLVLLSAIIMLIKWISSRRRRAHRPQLSVMALNQALVVRVYIQLNRLLRRTAIGVRRSYQTPLEYLNKIEQACSEPFDFSQDKLRRRELVNPMFKNVKASRAIPALAFPAIVRLTELLNQVRYGPGPVSDDQVDAAQDALAEVKQAFRQRV